MKIKNMQLPIFSFAIALSLVASVALGEENAPEADRALTAKILEESLAREAVKVKYAGSADERHKEMVGPIVTYWWSQVAVKAEFVDAANRLKVNVPKMFRGADSTTIHVTAIGPIKGEASGKALTDDKIELLSASSPFITTIEITAECVLTRVEKNGEVQVKIEIKNWKPVLKDTKFDSPIVDKLRGPIQDAANNKLTEAANPLRDVANTALKKAYDDGKLKLGN